MKRLLLYPMMSVVMLAGEPAVGATIDLPLPPHAPDARALLAPLLRLVGAITAAPAPEPTTDGATLLEREGWSAPVRRSDGLYALADFPDDREVLAVGVRAESYEARVALRMEK